MPHQVRMEQNAPPCLARVRATFSTLTDAEQRVARVLLEDPHLVLHSSIAELARQAGAGVSTVSRLSAKLGYSAFPDLKVSLAVELLTPDRGFQEPVRPGDGTAMVIRKVLDSGAQMLFDTADLLDPEALEAAATRLAAARRVELYAIGILTGSVARQAEGRLRLLQIPCTAVIDRYEHEPCAALLTSGDVAIGLSYSGDSEEVVRAITTAADGGATTICVTTSAHSPLANASEISLLVAAQGSGRWGDLVTSRMAMLGAIESLYTVALFLRHQSVPAGS